MNTQIQEAANKWATVQSIEDMSPENVVKFKAIVNKYYPGETFASLSDEQIVSIYMQEVVMKWWVKLSTKKLDELMEGYGFPSRNAPITQEEIATIYLKEHESKEEIIQNPNCPFCMLGIRYDNPENGEMCAYHKRLYESKEVSNVSYDKVGDVFIDSFGNEYSLTSDDGKLFFSDKAVSYPYPDKRFTKVPKEEPVSDENIDDYPPVTGNDVVYEGELLTKKPVSVSVEEAANKCAEEEKMWGLDSVRARINFTSGANWQKEQDTKELEEVKSLHIIQLIQIKEQSDAIIGELLEAAKGAATFLTETGTVGSYLNEKIAKATNYLNQQ